MDIISNWSFKYPPRPNQILALQWLANQNAKYLILESPVGSGKSNIGITYSQYLGNNSFILTPQRILQAQYERSFLNNSDIKLASFYGKSNYQCHTKKANCDVGSIVKPKCSKCPFDIAKAIARESPNVVLNYRLALLLFSFSKKTFTKRNLIIFDECHTLENHLINFDAVRISENTCKHYKLKFIKHTNLTLALNWIKEYYYPQLKNVVSKRLNSEVEILLEKDSYKLTSSEIKQIKEYEQFLDHLDEIELLNYRNIDYINNNFVLVQEPLSFQFKRVYGSYSFESIVNPMAERFLFMSSTILNKDGFCHDLGIDSKNTAFLSLDSDFPKENRPIYYMPQMKVNASWNSSENINGRKKLIDTSIKLLEIHKKEKGIIHTANYSLSEWIVKELTSAKILHNIYHHNLGSNDDRNDVIEAFTEDSKPSILISPSSTEGLDLKEDLGRFAIFIKVPFGNLGDQWIKRRMELSTEWYQRQALINVIQGGGRIVRTNTDWGSVYILDGSWGFLLHQSKQIIPKWWLDAYQIV